MRIALTIVLVTLSICAHSQAPTPDPLIKRTASLTLKVEKFSQTQAELEKLIASSAAEIKTAQAYRTVKGRRHGWFVITVPKQNLEQLVAQLRGLGKPTAEVWNKQQRGPIVASIDARVVRLAQHENRMLGMLSNGRRLRANDTLYIHDRVFRTETDQDRLKLERDSLVADSTTSGIMLTAFEPYLATETQTLQQGRLKAFVSESQSIALDAGKWFALTGLKVVMYLPVWLPLALCGRKLWRKYYVKSN